MTDDERKLEAFKEWAKDPATIAELERLAKIAADEGKRMKAMHDIPWELLHRPMTI